MNAIELKNVTKCFKDGDDKTEQDHAAAGTGRAPQGKSGCGHHDPDRIGTAPCHNGRGAKTYVR